MTVHRLKRHPDPFDLTAAGLKLHEVRVSDRDFQTGDTVVLERWDPKAGDYCGQVIEARIGHVTKPGMWGLPDNVCVFSLLNVRVNP